jgi:hypothetical protein
MFFLDSSQSYNAATVLRRYTSGSVIGGVVPVAGGYGLSQFALYKAFSDVASNHVYIGEACFGMTLGGMIGALRAINETQIAWYVHANGGIQIIRGPIEEIGTSAPDLIHFSPSDAYYIEADIILDATAGQVRIYIDGALVVDLTGINTIYGAAPVIPFHWDGVSRGSNSYAYTGAHYYVGDGATLPNRLGPIRVDRARLAADDSVSWTPVGGANWQAVNDYQPPDDDATYTHSDTIGATDLFVPVPLTTTGVVLGFQIGVQGRRTADGVAALEVAVKQGALVDLGPEGYVGLTYHENSRKAYYATLPDGTTPITDAGLSALRVGYRKTV